MQDQCVDRPQRVVGYGHFVGYSALQISQFVGYGINFVGCVPYNSLRSGFSLCCSCCSFSLHLPLFHFCLFVLFLSPLKGEITNRFDLKKGHYGIDVIASNNEAVKAILNGTVVYADWTPENGHVIQLQHAQNLVSTYKHNSFLLKKTGDLVKAGDAVAIVGNSGELSTGPHLHFELWHNGIPLDPEKFVVFD